MTETSSLEAGEDQKAAAGGESNETPPAPTPFATTTVPAGYTIDFYTEPKRIYKVDGEEAVSVTTVLNCLDKPALPWWGMTVGAEGVVELVERGRLLPTTHPEKGVRSLAFLADDGNYYVANKEALTQLLTQEKLTTNHVRDEAAERGLNAHDAFEMWGVTGETPDPSKYIESEQGYVRGLVKFIEDTQGKFVIDSQEIIVGSKEHLFAGRYDLRAHTTDELRLVTSAYTTKGEIRKRGPKYVTMPAGISILGDVKTSKGVYGSHLLQLEGYEGASIECGYEPTDARAVIHITRDGLYEFKRARASYEDFLAILATYHALERVEEALKL